MFGKSLNFYINFYITALITIIVNGVNLAQKSSYPKDFKRHVGLAPATSDWEAGLREATYQALLKEHVSLQRLRDRIMEAPLVGKQDRGITPFGDVAILARGQLYLNQRGFRFFQDPYQNDCVDCHDLRECTGRECEIYLKNRFGERILALWSIKRIRHRDPDPRFELEYVVSPIRRQGLVTRSGGFNYAIPGHVFVVRTVSVHNDKYDGHKLVPHGWAHLNHPIPAPPIVSRPPPVVSLRPPHNVYLPQRPPHIGPTKSSDEKLKELEAYQNLINVLKSKTTTTQHVPAPSTSPTFVTEQPMKTTMPFRVTTINYHVPTTTQFVKIPLPPNGDIRVTIPIVAMTMRPTKKPLPVGETTAIFTSETNHKITKTKPTKAMKAQIPILQSVTYPKRPTKITTTSAHPIQVLTPTKGPSTMSAINGMVVSSTEKEIMQIIPTEIMPQHPTIPTDLQLQKSTTRRPTTQETTFPKVPATVTTYTTSHPITKYPGQLTTTPSKIPDRFTIIVPDTTSQAEKTTDKFTIVYPDESDKPTISYPTKQTTTYPSRFTSKYPDRFTTKYPGGHTSKQPDVFVNTNPPTSVTRFPDKFTTTYQEKSTTKYPEKFTTFLGTFTTKNPTTLLNMFTEYPDKMTKQPDGFTTKYPDQTATKYPDQITTKYPDQFTTKYPAIFTTIPSGKFTSPSNHLATFIPTDQTAMTDTISTPYYYSTQQTSPGSLTTFASTKHPKAESTSFSIIQQQFTTTPKYFTHPNGMMTTAHATTEGQKQTETQSSTTTLGTTTFKYVPSTFVTYSDTPSTISQQRPTIYIDPTHPGYPPKTTPTTPFTEEPPRFTPNQIDTTSYQTSLIPTPILTTKPSGTSSALPTTPIIEMEDYNAEFDVFPEGTKIRTTTEKLVTSTQAPDNFLISDNGYKPHSTTKPEIVGDFELFEPLPSTTETSVVSVSPVDSKEIREVFDSQTLKPKVTHDESEFDAFFGTITTSTSTSPSTFKIIYSDFFEPSTTSPIDQNGARNLASTSQSFSTSVSFLVNNRKNGTKIVKKLRKLGRTKQQNQEIVRATSTIEKVAKPTINTAGFTKAEFDDLALTLVNNARSIDYLDNKPKIQKYKRKNYGRVRKVKKLSDSKNIAPNS